MIAHGGLAGAIVESFVALAVVTVFVAVWLRERSARKHDEKDELTDPVD